MRSHAFQLNFQTRITRYEGGRYIRLFALTGPIVLIICVLSACSSAPKKPATIKPGDYGFAINYLSWLIEEEMKKYGAVGLSVALVDDQNLVWSRGFGYANKQKALPASADTLYRIGSISKLFTASAAMQRVGQGRINLDAPLQKYLPGFSMQRHFSASQPVTIRNILTHHSGLPSDYVKGSWSNQPMPPDDFLQRLSSEYLAAPPDLHYAYSNLGFTLLGMAMAHEAGQPFAEMMHELLFTPMEMRRTSIERFAPALNDVARPYREGEEKPIIGLGNSPAGGMWSSANDMAKFIRMVFANGRANGQSVLDTELLTQMLTRQNTSTPLDFDQKVGLSWILTQSLPEVGMLAEHGGGTLYFRSQLKILPKHKIGIVVLCNAELSKGLVNKIASRGLKLMYEAKTGKYLKSLVQKKNVPAEVPQIANLPFELSGLYASDAGLLKISKDDHRYRIQALGRELDMVPREGGYFSLQYYLFGFIPWKVGNMDKILLRPVHAQNRDVLALTINNKELLFAEKFIPNPIPDSWRAWYGELAINNPDDRTVIKNIRLEEKNNILFASFLSDIENSSAKTVPLQVINDRLAVIAGLGRGRGLSIQIVKKNGHEQLMFSGYELQRVATE